MRLHTRTGTIKRAPAWVFFKTCNFTHLNAVLPRCVCVCVCFRLTQSVLFLPIRTKIKFHDFPREIKLPELSRKPSHTCVNTGERRVKLMEKTAECVWMGRPHLFRLGSAGGSENNSSDQGGEEITNTHPAADGFILLHSWCYTAFKISRISASTSVSQEKITSLENPIMIWLNFQSQIKDSLSFRPSTPIGWH